MYKANSRFLRKMTFQNMYTFLHNGFSEILNLSYFAHPLRSFSKAPPPPGNLCKRLTFGTMSILHTHMSKAYRCIVFYVSSTFFYVILPLLSHSISLCKVNTIIIAANFAFYFWFSCIYHWEPTISYQFQQ